MNVFLCFRVNVEQSFDRFSVFYVRFDDFFNIVGFYFNVADIQVGNNHQNALFTKTVAACGDCCHFFVVREGSDVYAEFFESFNYLERAVCNAAGSRAYQNAQTLCFYMFERFFTFFFYIY